MFSALIAPITGMISGWFESRQKIKQAKLNMKIAEMENKARLLRDEQSHNADWEMANLRDKDKILRFVSYAVFSAPLVAAIFYPEQVKIYFEETITAIPEWWVQIFVTINGAVWGIASLKNTLPALIDGVKKVVKKS